MAVIVKEDKKILVTPISREDLKDIHIGDIVYLSGDLTTCRDVAHRRVVEEGREIPVDVRDEVRNLVRSTAYSLRAMPSSLPKRSRKSSKPSGRIWACRKPSGTAMSKNSAR